MDQLTGSTILQDYISWNRALLRGGKKRGGILGSKKHCQWQREKYFNSWTVANFKAAVTHSNVRNPPFRTWDYFIVYNLCPCPVGLGASPGARACMTCRWPPTWSNVPTLARSSCLRGQCLVTDANRGTISIWESAEWKDVKSDGRGFESRELI